MNPTIWGFLNQVPTLSQNPEEPQALWTLRDRGENVFNYDKGVLGEVLEDVMGKGHKAALT